MRISLLFFVSVVFVAIGSTSPADASYRYCNETSYALEASISYLQGERSVSRGWFTLYPGTCRTVITGNLDQPHYFVFARSLDVHGEDQRVIGGNHRYCVGQDDFTVMDSDSGCADRGHAEVDFFRVDIGKERNWMTVFSETESFPPHRANIAGVQRLLAAAGYKAGSIDGYMGGRTRRALRALKKKHKMPADTTINSRVFAALVKDIRKSQEVHGFSICNETGLHVAAAFARRVKEKWSARGWFQLTPNTCAKTFSDALKEETYYIYAQAENPDGELIEWNGKFPLCTKKTRFSISEHERCGELGYEKTAFRKVVTEGKGAWVERLTLN